MQTAPRRNRGEVCTISDALIDDSPDALPKGVQLDEVLHDFWDGRNETAELECTPSSGAPYLRSTIAEEQIDSTIDFIGRCDTVL